MVKVRMKRKTVLHWLKLGLVAAVKIALAT
jgi:hypothetical protein